MDLNDEAETLEVQAMETRMKVLGAEHPDTLTSMGNLAHTLKAVGNHQSAFVLMEDCALISHRILLLMLFIVATALATPGNKGMGGDRSDGFGEIVELVAPLSPERYLAQQSKSMKLCKRGAHCLGVQLLPKS